MNHTIQIISPDKLVNWDDYITRSSKSSIYQKSAWLKSIAVTYNLSVYHLACIENAQIIGVLPLTLIRSPLTGKSLISVPFATSGGLCADDAVVARELVEAAITLSEKLHVDPFLYRLLIGEDEQYTSWIVFSIIMLGVLINSGYRPMSGMLVQGSRPGSYTIIILTLLFIDGIANFLLIPVIGIYGAALVAALIYLLEALFIIISAKSIFKIDLINGK